MKEELGTLSSGQLARVTGVSTDTLRHYERTGVLPSPQRGPNSYRRYPHDAVARVQLIRRALGVGFTLEELARFLRIRDRGGAPCAQVRELAASKLEAIEHRLGELISLRDQLRDTLRAWDKQLTRTPRGKPARLLEKLMTTKNGAPSRPFSTHQTRKINK